VQRRTMQPRWEFQTVPGERLPRLGEE
jgi:hypothetical protein